MGIRWIKANQTQADVDQGNITAQDLAGNQHADSVANAGTREHEGFDISPLLDRRTVLAGYPAQKIEYPQRKKRQNKEVKSYGGPNQWAPSLVVDLNRG
eukprot:447085-Amphidinium_carterae.1